MGLENVEMGLFGQNYVFDEAKARDEIIYYLSCHNELIQLDESAEFYARTAILRYKQIGKMLPLDSLNSGQTREWLIERLMSAYQALADIDRDAVPAIRTYMAGYLQSPQQDALGAEDKISDKVFDDGLHDMMRRLRLFLDAARADKGHQVWQKEFSRLDVEHIAIVEAAMTLWQDFFGHPVAALPDRLSPSGMINDKLKEHIFMLMKCYGLQPPPDLSSVYESWRHLVFNPRQAGA